MFSSIIGVDGHVSIMDVAPHFTKIQSPERHRRLNRGLSDPPLRKEHGIFGSPKAQHNQQQQQQQHHHPSWWQTLKGLGKRRRKSTTSAHTDNTMEMTWHVNQVENLSQEKNSTGDFVSCLAFDETGDLLGAGCKSGKIVVYSQDTEKGVENDGSESGTTQRNQTFVPYVSFQSHDPEFDYLKSVEIDEKINQLRWLKRRNQAHFLLATNERNVKLWKIAERRHELDNDDELDQRSNTNSIHSSSRSGSSALQLPRYKRIDPTVLATPRRSFFSAHDYRINSISLNSDLETFITADDLRINLWHLEVPHVTFNIVDTKPDPSEELSEVITSAEFHPFTCGSFAYGSSKGTIRLCDLRSQSRCHKPVKTFTETLEEGSKTFFSDIISCISDLKFSDSGRYLLSRDYLNLKIWDLQMESKPVETYPVCPGLRSKLCTLYENDHIFDKFDCSWGCSDRFVVSGTYSNFLKVHDRTTGRGVMLDSNFVSMQNNRIHWKGKHSFSSKSKVSDEVKLDSLNFKKKLLHCAWRPNENHLTNAIGCSLVFIQGKDSSPDLI